MDYRPHVHEFIGKPLHIVEKGLSFSDKTARVRVIKEDDRVYKIKPGPYIKNRLNVTLISGIVSEAYWG